MPTLGEELRHRREQRGITLAEIAESTRIGTRFLKAIEINNFSTLPGGIFTRSFIRAYAKHVGMDEDEAIGLYLHQIAEQSGEPPSLQPEKATPAVNVAKPPASISSQTTSSAVLSSDTARRFEPVAYRQSASRTRWSTIVIGAGIVIFIALIVVALVKQLNQNKGETGSQPASAAQKNVPSKPSGQPPPQSATVPNSPAPSQAEQPSTSVAPGQPLVVKIEATTGDSFVSYQVDDSKPTSLTLKKGEAKDLPPAQNQVALKYGNRLVLKISINNRDANFPPDSPKFASKVVISRESLQTFFQ